MVTDRHLRFLKIAKSAALRTTDLKRQVGAVIVDCNKIVAIGRNRKSHPRIPKYVAQSGERYFSLHAEIEALLRCDISVRGMTVFIHGQNLRSGKYVYSKPCELCEHFLRERGISRAVFSTPQGYEVCDL